MKPSEHASFDFEPAMERKAMLIKKVQELEAQDATHKQAMIGMQATTILQAMYVRQVQGHLQEHKAKANKKKTKNR